MTQTVDASADNGAAYRLGSPYWQNSHFIPPLGTVVAPAHTRSPAVTFWDVIWFIVVSFAFIFYLMMLFSIISDLFADRETGGFAKAI